jgi:hypothetical protein
VREPFYQTELAATTIRQVERRWSMLRLADVGVTLEAGDAW